MLDQGSGVEARVVVPDGATSEATADGVSNGQTTESTRTSELEREPVQESVLLECRLILGLADPQYLDPSTELPTLNDGSELGTFDERDYARAHERSVAERANHWREQSEDAAMEAWKASFVRDVTNPENADHVERLQWLQDTIRIDFNAFTPDSAARIHAHYFAGSNGAEASGTETGEETTSSEADTPEKKFARDVLAAYQNEEGINIEALRRDIESIQWFAEIFGEQSSKAITQYILGEANIITDRASFAAEVQAAAGSPLSENDIAILNFMRGEVEEEDEDEEDDEAEEPETEPDSAAKGDAVTAEGTDGVPAVISSEDDKEDAAGGAREDEDAAVEPAIVREEEPEEDETDGSAEAADDEGTGLARADSEKEADGLTTRDDGATRADRVDRPIAADSADDSAPQARVSDPPPVAPVRETGAAEPEPPAKPASAGEPIPPSAAPTGAAEEIASTGADEKKAPESVAEEAEPGTNPSNAESSDTPPPIDKRLYGQFRNIFSRMILPIRATELLSRDGVAAEYYTDPSRLNLGYATNEQSRFRLVPPIYNGRLVQLGERDTFLQTYEHDGQRFIRFAAGRQDGMVPFTIRALHLGNDAVYTQHVIDDRRGYQLPPDYADNVFFRVSLEKGPQVYMKLSKSGDDLVLASSDEVKSLKESSVYSVPYHEKNTPHASEQNRSDRPEGSNGPMRKGRDDVGDVASEEATSRIEEPEGVTPAEAQRDSTAPVVSETGSEASPPEGAPVETQPMGAAIPDEAAPEAGVRPAVGIDEAEAAVAEVDVRPAVAASEAEAVADAASVGPDVETGEVEGAAPEASVEEELVTEDPTEADTDDAEGEDGGEAGETDEDDIPSDLRLSGSAARLLGELDESDKDLGDTMGRYQRQRRSGEPDTDDKGNGRGRRKRERATYDN